MAQRFKLNYAPHLGLTRPDEGMFREHAGSDPVDQIKFMNREWNTKLANPIASPSNRFLNVQGITIDREDFLWLLDTGSPKRASVVKGGAKLVKVDLKTEKVVQVVTFNERVVPPQSYLNDVRVDAHRHFAYISETGETGGLLVVNLQSGASRKILAVKLSESAPLCVQMESKWMGPVTFTSRTLHAMGSRATESRLLEKVERWKSCKQRLNSNGFLVFIIAAAVSL